MSFGKRLNVILAVSLINEYLCLCLGPTLPTVPLPKTGIHAKSSGSHQQLFQQQQQQHQQQHLIIQPVEFDHRHRNLYGYLALGAFVLTLINFIMIKERSCQISLVNGYQNYDLIQSFHLTTLIVAIIVFILSYFNFALVIYDFKMLFYSSAFFIFICAALLIYDAVAIVSAPCIAMQLPNASQFLSSFGASETDAHNVFSARDGVGITVFFFDILAAGLMFFTGRRFYQRR